MKDGVYHVAFSSNIGSVGEGILIICCGLINGGDIGFVWQGKLAHPIMTLRITRYNEDVPSVLGIDNGYELIMQYSDETDEQYLLHGYVKESPQLTIQAYASFLLPLSENDHF